MTAIVWVQPELHDTHLPLVHAYRNPEMRANRGGLAGKYSKIVAGGSSITDQSQVLALTMFSPALFERARLDLKRKLLSEGLAMLKPLMWVGMGHLH